MPAWNAAIEKLGKEKFLQLLALSGVFYHLYNQVCAWLPVSVYMCALFQVYMCVSVFTCVRIYMYVCVFMSV